MHAENSTRRNPQRISLLVAGNTANSIGGDMSSELQINIPLRQTEASAMVKTAPTTIRTVKKES